MSWMARLYETYEQAMNRPSMENDYPMPVSHTVQTAHINIVIDGAGNFKWARVLPEKTQIVLPATEKSAGRSSGEAPHPLADKIQYVAGDYAQFGGLKAAYFEGFQAQLRNWMDSDHSHPGIEAIYHYVNKKTVVADLIREKILGEKDGVLLTSWDDEEESPPPIFKLLPKEKGQLDQGSALVCWSVEDSQVQCPETWKDPTIQKKWIDFDARQSNVKSLCYITGEEQVISTNHPAKLRHSGDKAKLISANDLSGYTFKGRFTDTKSTINEFGLQAASVGSITTQKAHNALRWLINRNRQGNRNGDQVIVAWAVSGKTIPSPIDEEIPDRSDVNYNVLDEEEEGTDNHALEKHNDEDYVEDLSKDLGQHYAKIVNKHMQGYRQNLEVNDTVSIMAIDSATPGRMGVTYYRESMPYDYLDDIGAWHTDFAWPQRVLKEVEGSKKTIAIWRVQAPAPYSILNAVYGDIIKSNETLKKQLYQRLLPCLVERICIPKDILQLSLYQAYKSSNKEYWEWERNIGVACALYKGFYIRHQDPNKRREYSMSLDRTITSRDYLYGRLLALAEKLEATALSIAKVNRPTTANRLMQRFTDRPHSTWLTINSQLSPYMLQLTSSAPGFLTNIRNEIDDVVGAFSSPDDFNQDTALSGEFLLGFHCQRLVLRKAKKKQNDSDNTTDPTHGEQP